MAGPITLLMLKHHKTINKLLSDFEKTPPRARRAIDLFNIFKKNLERHVFLEEAYIFPVTDKKNSSEMLQLQNLLRDHKDIKEIVGNLYDELSDGEGANVKILRELLFAHERREVESFYPRFDERLSDAEKRNMVKRIGELRVE